MKNINKVILVAFSMMTIALQAQVTYLEKLGNVLESNEYFRIEQNGKFSYSFENSIFSSYDEGLTWEETLTPLEFTTGYTKYKGLKNGNYVLVTGRKMHYRSNGQWNLLLVDGDSIFNTSISVIDDKVILFRENVMYAYDDNTNEVNQFQVSADYCCHWAEVFKNHFIVKTGDYERQIWTKDLQYVSTIDFDDSVFITKEGRIIKQRITSQGAGKYGNTLEISEDNGQSFSLFHESDKELRFIGEIDGRLYFKGYLTLYNAWLQGKFTSRLGYFDLLTGEVTEVVDEGGSYIANDILYHRIGLTYFKYPDGNLENRIKLSSLQMAARPIEKLRRAPDGLMYALTRNFLYKSYDDGKTWENLLDFHRVEDIDLDDEDNLYCLSEGKILKSVDEGIVFTEVPRQYPEGTIEFPNEIVCLGSDKLIVKGIGDFTQGGPSVVGCFDCYDFFPQYVFISDDDGTNWEPKYVSQSDYPLVTAADHYGYPSDQAIKSSYFVKTLNDVIFTAPEYHFFSNVYNYGVTIVDKTDLSVKKRQQLTDQSYNIRYGLTSSGDLIKNDHGQVYASSDCGVSYNELTPTNSGDMFPGATEESIYVISDNDLSEGVITYQSKYGTSFVELDFEIHSTNQAVPNSFDKVYTDGKSDFLFSGSDTYKIVDSISDVEETPITEQDSQINIFPNPVSEILSINMQESWSSFTKVEIFDTNARLISTYQIKEPQFEINLKNYDSGLYYLRIFSSNNIYQEKIFKL